MKYQPSQLGEPESHRFVRVITQLKDAPNKGCNVRLMHDWVMVELHELPEMYKGTIVLSQGETGSNLRTGTVLGYGPGVELGDGSREPIGVDRGEVVVFHRWNMEHKQGRMFDKFLGGGAALIRARDILLVLPEGEEGIDLT